MDPQGGGHADLNQNPKRIAQSKQETRGHRKTVPAASANKSNAIGSFVQVVSK